MTELLHDWKNGHKEAFDKLLPIVLGELKRRASAYLRNERTGHTLQTTALVNEAYLKLVDKENIDWEDRNHFFAIAANAMRQILVDYARMKKRAKRGGKDADLPLEDVAEYIPADEKSVDLVALDEALQELAGFDKRQAQIVELKYFCGMTNDETAEILGISNVTVRRDWNMAKAWLHQRIHN